ncbi:hypothetical protein WB36_20275 [Klebsiella pneumoniae subsp. pneumoniae]|nr:hypothetical protein WB36_20275 [Klebsiella pneumoniae subsp. pneumoniae]
MMSLWDALRMNMMISYQELVRTFPMRCRMKWKFTAMEKGISRVTACYTESFHVLEKMAH